MSFGKPILKWTQKTKIFISWETIIIIMKDVREHKITLVIREDQPNYIYKYIHGKLVRIIPKDKFMLSEIFNEQLT